MQRRTSEDLARREREYNEKLVTDRSARSLIVTRVSCKSSRVRMQDRRVPCAHVSQGERLYPSLSVGARARVRVRARARVGLNELPEKFFSVIYSCRTRQDLHPRVFVFLLRRARRESHFCSGKRCTEIEIRFQFYSKPSCTTSSSCSAHARADVRKYRSNSRLNGSL